MPGGARPGAGRNNGVPNSRTQERAAKAEVSSSSMISNVTSSRGREIAVEYRPVAALVANARNARIHSDAQVVEIASSIRRFGFLNPVLVYRGQDIVTIIVPSAGSAWTGSRRRKCASEFTALQITDAFEHGFAVCVAFDRSHVAIMGDSAEAIHAGEIGIVRTELIEHDVIYPSDRTGRSGKARPGLKHSVVPRLINGVAVRAVGCGSWLADKVEDPS